MIYPIATLLIFSIIIMAISIRFNKKKNDENAKTRSANNVKKAT